MVATVNSSGKVLARNKGTCKITATINGVSATCNVTVNYPNELAAPEGYKTFISLAKNVKREVTDLHNNSGKFMYENTTRGTLRLSTKDDYIDCSRYVGYVIYQYLYENGVDPTEVSYLSSDIFKQYKTWDLANVGRYLAGTALEKKGDHEGRSTYLPDEKVQGIAQYFDLIPVKSGSTNAAKLLNSDPETGDILVFVDSSGSGHTEIYTGTQNSSGTPMVYSCGSNTTIKNMEYTISSGEKVLKYILRFKKATISTPPSINSVTTYKDYLEFDLSDNQGIGSLKIEKYDKTAGKYVVLYNNGNPASGVTVSSSKETVKIASDKLSSSNKLRITSADNSSSNFEFSVEIDVTKLSSADSSGKYFKLIFAPKITVDSEIGKHQKIVVENSVGIKSLTIHDGYNSNAQKVSKTYTDKPTSASYTINLENYVESNGKYKVYVTSEDVNGYKRTREVIIKPVI